MTQNLENRMTNSLKGQILVATPNMGDPRFFESVVYLIEHNENGAMGFVVNQPMLGMQFRDILEQLNLGSEEELIKLPKDICQREIYRGGPVEQGRGFVLHSNDCFIKNNTYQIDKEISLTASIDILKSLAFGPAPKKSLLALGYCGWGEGQLENELKNDGWLVTNYNEDLLFNIATEKRYEEALRQIGVTRASLSPTSGSA